MSLSFSPAPVSPPAGRKQTRRFLTVVAVLTVLALAAAGAAAATRVMAAAQAVNPKTTIAQVIGAVTNQADVPGSLAYRVYNGDRVNILMLGYGGTGHDGAYLTDSMMVLSLQGADRIALTSIPRDTYVSIPAFAGTATYDGKINAAFELPLANGSFGPISATYNAGFDGAGALASRVVGDYLGISVDYWVGIDFTAFKTVVDAIGGIDVVNPTVLDDYQYPAGETGGYMHIHFDAGLLHLNGDQALIYVRERHADSDFGRSRRQQQVIAAVKDRVASVGMVAQLPTLLNALAADVHTNMTPNDVKVLGSMSSAVSSAATHRVSIDNTNWQYDSSSWATGDILLPRDPSGAALNHFIQAEMVDPAVTAEATTVQVVSGPRQYSLGQGAAEMSSATLAMLNFRIAAPRTVTMSPLVTQVHDRSGGAATKTAAWLAAYYGGVVVTEAPAPGLAPVVVDLGLNSLYP